MKDILVSFLRIYHGTTLDDPAHSSAGKFPGGMFPSQHNVQQNSQCINIRTPIRLGEPILFLWFQESVYLLCFHFYKFWKHQNR